MTVLTVPPGVATDPEAPFKTVLCAIDFSESSAAALQLARSFVAPTHGRLLIVHVVDWPSGHIMRSDPVSVLRRNLEEQAVEQLSMLAREVGSLPDMTASIVRAGPPKREILELARAEGVDLIVMGATGRGAVQLALLGSTSSGVIREAECPVLTVRQDSTNAV